MPKKKKQGKILNDKRELPVDATAVKDGQDWHSKTVAAESTTKLEDDHGEGQAVKLFFFEFGVNPAAFKIKKPTSQELFNSHYKQIEINLWEKGWKVFPDVNPRLMFAKDKSHYRIIVGATQARGRILTEQPKTLSEISA